MASVEGELDIATASRLEEAAEVAVSAGRPLVLDLSGCSFIDSSGLRAVLRAQAALGEAGQSLALVTDRLQARKLLSLTAVDLRVRVFDARYEAITWVCSDRATVQHAAEPFLTTTNGGP